MNYKMMGRFIAQILSIEGLFMIPALIISLCGGTAAASMGFLIAIGIIAVLVLVLGAGGMPKHQEAAFDALKEKGVKVYEIEFKKDRVEYSAEISVDGEIISWETDND